MPEQLSAPVVLSRALAVVPVAHLNTCIYTYILLTYIWSPEHFTHSIDGDFFFFFFLLDFLGALEATVPSAFAYTVLPNGRAGSAYTSDKDQSIFSLLLLLHTIGIINSLVRFLV